MFMIRLQVKKQMHTPEGEEWLDIDVAISSGQFSAVFGESGAGKTTLLRILAGLTSPDQGYIEVDGEIWFDSQKKINLPIQQRKIGFVFQESSLFPHMTVRENLEYACADLLERQSIDGWILTLGLKGLESKKPEKISGGQKQRVALIRAILSRPKILLLDEPLSNLDSNARQQLQDEIVKVIRNTGITTILVSHDLSEVVKMSQKVFVIQNGRIVKSGSPYEVF